MTLRLPSIDMLPQHHREQAMRQMHPARTAAPAAPDPAPRMAPRKPRRDDEHNEQVVFFNRIRTLALNDARFAAAADRTYAIPNGGGRTKREAGRLKAEGVRSGVSDVFCSFPAGGCHGLYIEMKSATGRASREQADWLQASRALGYHAECCRGADEAFKVWRAYVEGGE